jgi:hypothetical protein
MIKEILRKNRFTSRLLETYFFSKKYLKPKGWFESRYLHQPIDSDMNPLPWFTYSSIHFISQKLSLKPMRVFEFGSGNSTLWFSSRVESIVSIEHETDFYSKILKKLRPIDNVSYELRKLNDNYNQKILEFENEFDIVIIDGRERVQCTKNCIKALKKNGVIIFDNSDRIQYKEAYNYLTEHRFKKIDFRGVGAIGHSEWQTTIYYRNDNCFEI